MLNVKRMRFPLQIILVCIRWYAAYALSYRNLEEMMQERGVSVDHSTVNRWAIRFLPLLEKIFRRKYKRPVGSSWRMDETYIKVNGDWQYLYRAVDKQGNTIGFLLRAKRDKVAARKSFEKAMALHGDPEKVTMDEINQHREVPIEVRQIKYLNNIVEQDHRSVKRITKPMMGFKSFPAARNVLAGIELMHRHSQGSDDDRRK